MKELKFLIDDTDLKRIASVKDKVQGYTAHHINKAEHCFTRGLVTVMILITGNDAKFVKSHATVGLLEFDYDYVRKFIVCRKSSMSVNELLVKIMQTPSIKEAIERGDYTAAAAEEELRDQIVTGDAANGLLLLDDLPEDVRMAIAG